MIRRRRAKENRLDPDSNWQRILRLFDSDSSLKNREVCSRLNLPFFEYHQLVTKARAFYFKMVLPRKQLSRS